MESLKLKPWWNYLEEDLSELLAASFLLSDKVGMWDEKFHDYSFVVFPAAKAFEGFLKKLFLDLGFISNEDYYGKRFRIGRALNPQLEKRYRAKESIYDRLAHFTGDKVLGDELWQTWKQSRNLVFHWFPEEKNAITYEESKLRIEMIIAAIDRAYKECLKGLSNKN